MRAPAESSAPAEWLKSRLKPWPDPDGGVRVGSVVPTGFEAYARILHAPDPQGMVTWSEVAASTGRIAHPLMEWHRITTPVPESGLDAWDRSRGEPLEGEPSDSELHALAGVLRQYTRTRDRCWFCSWVGFGGTRERGAQVSLPNREYFLSSGPIAEVNSFENAPNIWWPEDRSWCVASEIDLLATYVGGSEECIKALLEAEGFEAFAVAPADRLDAEADAINRG